MYCLKIHKSFKGIFVVSALSLDRDPCLYPCLLIVNRNNIMLVYMLGWAILYIPMLKDLFNQIIKKTCNTCYFISPAVNYIHSRDP